MIILFHVCMTGRCARDQRRSLRCVWDHSVLLGAATDKPCGGFLQGPETQPEPGKTELKGYKSHIVYQTEPCLLTPYPSVNPSGSRRDDQQPQFQLQSVFLRQPAAVRQR